MLLSVPAPGKSGLPGQSSSYKISWLDSWDDFTSEITKIFNNKGKDIFLIDENVNRLHKEKISTLFSKKNIIKIPQGETSKSFSMLEKMTETLYKKGIHRNDRLWAVGGGVVGDLTGFLASVYLRGIAYYQVPTTLLSMVDSSVGGKTGINLTGGKNLVGAFYRPCGVFIHLPFLTTLPKCEKKSGLAEALKSAIIRPADLLRFIEKDSQAIKDFELSFIKTLSQESIKIKVNVVKKDEQEKGLRAILNFGHTLAHGIEAALNYKEFTHGEAVSVGMHFASFLSYKRGLINEKYLQKIISLQKNLGLPVYFSDVPKEKSIKTKILVQLMNGDKKNVDDNIRFTLINNRKAIFPVSFSQKELHHYIEEFRGIRN